MAPSGDLAAGSNKGVTVFEFHVSSRPLGDDAWVVWLAGEVDMHVAPELAAELHSLADAGAREIVVHLGGIELIDSTALGVLLRARDAIKRTGGEIVLVTATGGSGDSSR